MRLAELYKDYSMPDKGGDKGTAHTYIDIYEEHISKTDSVALLEFGVYEGHSLALWQKYLTNSEVIGVDIELNKLSFDVTAIQADCTIPVPELQGKQFDYIIDDASHRLDDQLKTLRWAWSLLKDGGVFFIEDIIGAPEATALIAEVAKLTNNFKLYDNRHLKGRSDDILLVAYKVN